MRTVKQVSALTGVSVRALQYYDEIGLLKPSQVTEAGYRLYGEEALEKLQQILFLRELDFSLWEIKAMLESPGFDRRGALLKQRDLLCMKRDRLSALLGLMDKLIQGEKCMDFKEFDLSGYFRALMAFKETHLAQIEARYGSVAQFEEMVAGLREREAELANLALEQYESLDDFTAAMKKSFQDDLENGPAYTPEQAARLVERTDALTRELVRDLARDPAGPEAQAALAALISLVEESNAGAALGSKYWKDMEKRYASNPVWIETTDKKYGEGASAFLSRALKAYIK